MSINANVLEIEPARAAKREQSLPLNDAMVVAAFQYFCAEYNVRFRRDSHETLLKSRKYCSLKEIELALKRYKVFGDLGC